MDMVPRTPWLRGAWKRARYAFNRPASPTEVLSYIYLVDAVGQFIDFTTLKHKPGCYCAGKTAFKAKEPGRCTCGLTDLFFAVKNLRRNVLRYSP